MTFLEQIAHKNGLNPVAAMNFLQETGVVSDNAVALADVAAADITAAADALARRFRFPMLEGFDLLTAGKGWNHSGKNYA